MPTASNCETVPAACFGFILRRTPTVSSVSRGLVITRDGVNPRRGWCRREGCWNRVWRHLRRDKATGSGSEVNGRDGERLGQGLPAVDLAHGDLARGEQRPEQHGRGLGRGQDRPRLDPPLELLVRPLDRVP